MPSITDTTLDLSSLANTYDPIVPSGLVSLLFLGKTLPLSLRNLSPGGGVSAVATGAPVINASSGAGVNNGNFIDTQLFQGTSETLYIVCGLSTFGVALGVPLACTNSSNIEGVSLIGGNNPFHGLQAAVALNISGTNVAEPLVVYPDNSAASQAMFLSPQMYVLRIDFVGMQLYFKNLSSPGLATATFTIPAGATRQTGFHGSYLFGQQHAGAATQVSNVHFFAQYNRATTLTEDAAIYAQVKSSLALRGVTI
jgi:hypothetical protein